MPAGPRNGRARIAAWLTAAVAGGVLATELVGSDPVGYGALGLAAACALLAVVTWDRVVTRVGPRHVLDLVLPFSALVLLVFAVWGTLGLPDALRWLTHPLLAVSLTLAWRGTAHLPGGERPTGRRWRMAGAAGAGALLALAGLLAANVPTALVHLVLLAATLAAWRSLDPLGDPLHPGPSPLVPYVPWSQVPGRPWPSARHRVPLRAPATVGYLVASWVLFLWLGDPGVGGWWGLDTGRYEAYLFEIPDLSRATLEALASLATAPLLNHDHVQLIYVTALLGLFGLPFEVREGSIRAVLVFAATGVVGALAAGILLHGIHPVLEGHRVIDHAWERTWSGGSVGAFGLMGALSARARRPWPVFGFFVFWEANVGAWYLRSFTPAFHLTALVAGFLLARYALEPRG